jgi:hypothetical protein
VTIGGYNIQNIATANRPQSAAAEHRYWYQWNQGDYPIQ